MNTVTRQTPPYHSRLPHTNTEFEFCHSMICPKDLPMKLKQFKQFREYYQVKHEIASEIQPERIVEIGVRAGYSALAFLSACNAEYKGFDAENGKHGGKGGPYTWWAEKVLKERGYDFKIFAPFDTQEMPYLPGTAADLYHVDGDHTTEGVQHDLTLCFNDAPTGAYILADDYDYLKTVRKGIDQWLKRYEPLVKWEHRKSLRGEILIQKIAEASSGGA